MVIVQEDSKEWNSVFVRLRVLVGVRADLSGRAVRTRDRAALELDELECFNRLRLTVFDDFEIGLLQVRNGRAALIRNDDIDPNEIDSCAELRQLTLVRRILIRGRGRLA